MEERYCEKCQCVTKWRWALGVGIGMPSPLGDPIYYCLQCRTEIPEQEFIAKEARKDIIVSIVITYGGLACPATFEIDVALLGVTPTPVEFIHGEMLPYVEEIWNRLTLAVQQAERTMPPAPPTKEADHE